MTADSLRSTLRTLNVGQAWLARQLKVHPNTVSLWATGAVPVPGYAEAFLRLAQGNRDLMQSIDL